MQRFFQVLRAEPLAHIDVYCFIFDKGSFWRQKRISRHDSASVVRVEQASGGTEIVNVVCDRMRRGPRGRGWVIVEVLREASVFQLGELIIARTC